MSDLAQVLAGAVPGAPGAATVTDTLDVAFRSHRGSQSKVVVAAQAAKKKVKGMSREVYNLLGVNAVPPLVSAGPRAHRAYLRNAHVVPSARAPVRGVQMPEKVGRPPSKPANVKVSSW